MTRVLVVVQARAGSTRLPGKVLADIEGRPMLGLMLGRLDRLRGSGAEVIVATTRASRDDAVAEVAAEAGVPVSRGDEQDVLGRFLTALGQHPADTVVRLTADCPLIDPALVLQAIERHQVSGATYTSNTLVRTFPDGLDVEVVDAGALRVADDEAADPDEREHVTPFLYRRPRRFRLDQVVGADLRGDERWTVDTEEDLDTIRSAVARLDDPLGAPWTDVLARVGPRAPLPGFSAQPDGAVAHRRGHPYTRRWRLEDCGSPRGTATVDVDDGVGALILDVAADEEEAARAAIARRLTADLQVRTLVDHPLESSP